MVHSSACCSSALSRALLASLPAPCSSVAVMEQDSNILRQVNPAGRTMVSISRNMKPKLNLGFVQNTRVPLNKSSSSNPESSPQTHITRQIQGILPPLPKVSGPFWEKKTVLRERNFKRRIEVDQGLSRTSGAADLEECFLTHSWCSSEFSQEAVPLSLSAKT